MTSEGRIDRDAVSWRESRPEHPSLPVSLRFSGEWASVWFPLQFCPSEGLLVDS